MELSTASSIPEDRGKSRKSLVENVAKRAEQANKRGRNEAAGGFGGEKSKAAASWKIEI